MKNNNLVRGAALAIAAASSSATLASMGNVGTTYGILPGDVASAQALSMFNPQVSAVYYNPAYLTEDARGELTTGLLHADHELQARSLGGAAPANRQGDVLQDSPSQQTLIGLKTNLSSLTKLNHPIYFGVMIGVEKYGEEMLAFESETSRQGQYFEYGRQPLFLNLGGATQIVPGLDVGASARITLHSEAELRATTDLGGNTQYEELRVSAKPSIRPILSANLDWGEAFCGDGNDCWFDRIETAFAFRGYSNTNTTVDANTVIPGTVAEPGLSLAVSTLDSYQPNIYSTGLLYKGDRFRIGASVEMQQWSELEDEFDSDTIKDQAVNGEVGMLEFQDIVVPRLGAEYHINDTFMVTGGVAYSESPLESNASLNVNYLDADKWIAGLGLSAEYKDTRFLAYPVRFDLGYQYQKLEAREFDLYHTESPTHPEPYETVEAEGDVHVFTGSVTLKF